MTPDELLMCRWAQMMGGSIVHTDVATCSTGSGRCIDYAILCARWKHAYLDIQTHDSPTSPHWPVTLKLRGLRLSDRLPQRKRWKSFPRDRIVGCGCKPPEVDWPWEQGQSPPNMEQAWTSWLTNIELELCALHNIGDDVRFKYIGRVQGLVVESVSLAQIWKTYFPPRTTQLAKATRVLVQLGHTVRAGVRRHGSSFVQKHMSYMHHAGLRDLEPLTLFGLEWTLMDLLLALS
eukprot:1645629-Amphidinium_carterae.1